MEFFSLASMVLLGGFTAIAIISYIVGLIMGINIGKKERKDER